MREPAHVFPRDILVSAPGSFMLSGEHAVLRGFTALVAATQHRVTVRLQARRDDVIAIRSALGAYEMRVGAIVAEHPFHFAAAAIEAGGGQHLLAGFDLVIEAAMPPDVGLGSSAAVTVAVYAAVYAYVHGYVPEEDALWRACRDVIRTVQGRGSGADVAASVYGGVFLYAQDDGVLEQWTCHLPEVSLFYVGYKTPTAEVIEIVEKKRLQSPEMFHQLDLRMEQATQAAAAAMRNGDMFALGRALQGGQEALQGYGVCDAKIDEVIACLQDACDVMAAKISGSGLGDCVLVLGNIAETVDIPFRQIPVSIDDKGICAELK